MAWNVVASWAGHMVFVVTGFILPRFMDRHLGQEALGIWDLAWSFVSYFGIAQIGIGSSVNRYVAKYRATGDVAGLNRAVASAMRIQLIAALVVVLLTIGATAALPGLFNARLGGRMVEAQWVVALLGAGLAVQMALNAYVGVITGCHRWDIHNFINAGFYAATVAIMIGSLRAGGGLKSLALVNCCGTVVTEVTRAIIGHRVCPELRLRLGAARWAETIDMLMFGGKSALNSVSRLLLYQTSSMLIAGYLGPAALAVFSRPKALVANAQTLVGKLGFVLTPTASSLQAGGRHRDLRCLLIDTSRVATYLALPMVIFLCILGDPLLHVWMGSSYRASGVLTLLAIGHLTEMTRQPAVSILAGMNAHGRVGWAGLAAAVLPVGLGVIGMGWLHGGVLAAAAAIVGPLVLINGTFVPVYACRKVGVPVRQYAVATNLAPVLSNVPFAVSLAVVRFWAFDRPVVALVAGCFFGGIVLGATYWKFALTPAQRSQCFGVARRMAAVPVSWKTG